MQPRLEQINPDLHASGRHHVRRGRHFHFYWHMHVDVELTLIAKGTGQRFVGNSVERFGPGDLVLLGSELPHTWVTDDASTDNEAVVVQFHPDAVEPWPELERVRALLGRAERGVCFDSDQARRQLANLPTDPLPRWLAVLACLDGLAREPASRARALARGDYLPMRGRVDQRVRRTMTMISKSLNESITQAAAAERAGMSPQSFARLFKQQTGDTFTHYLQRLRVSRACQLLVETDAKVTAVAMRSGFDNLSNFNRVFRRWTSTTPSQYRRQHAATNRSAV